MKNIIILFYFSFSTLLNFTLNAQSDFDLNSCVAKLISIDEINPILFSLKNESGENILCIEGRYFQVNNHVIGLNRDFFESSRWKESVPVYVESPAFIHLYDIEYWLVIDSIDANEDTIEIFFKTTSSTQLSKYEYIVGKVLFEKQKGEWITINKDFNIGLYVPPFEDTEIYREKVKNAYQEMIREAQENIKRRSMKEGG